MATMYPDERAAGVISGSDPYRELELYLEKVNEEIGEVFDRWKSAETKCKPPVTPAIPIPPARRREHHLHTRKTKEAGSPVAPPRRSPRRRSDEKEPNNFNFKETETSNGYKSTNPKFEQCTLQEKHEENNHVRIRRNNSLKSHDSDGNKGQGIVRQSSLNSWSDSLLAEFNNIIADELNKLKNQEPESNDARNDKTSDKNKNEKENSCNRKDTMKLRISRSQSWDDHQRNCSDLCCAAPLSPANSDREKRISSLSKIMKRQLSSGVVLDSPEPGHAVLVRISSLPDDDVIHKTLSDSDISRRRKSRGTMTHGRKISVKSASIDLPVKVCSTNGNSRDGSIYKDVLRKGASSNNTKRYKEDFIEPILQYPERVNHVLGLRNQRLNHDLNFTKPYKRKESPRSTKDTPYVSNSCGTRETENADDGGWFRRTGSGKFPVALQNLLTKIRPNKSQVTSPVSPTSGDSFGVDCTSGAPVDTGTQTSPPISRSSSFTWVSDCSSSFLLNVNDSLDDDNRSTSSSADSRRHGNGTVCNCDYDCASSRDSLSDSASGSVESPDREEPESGIGTASPPRSKDHKVSLVTENAFNKPRRKETWERLRKRSFSGRPVMNTSCQDVWVRRESVETQTCNSGDENRRETRVKQASAENSNNQADSSSGQDDSSTATESTEPPPQEHFGRSRLRAVRPHCLPVKPQRLRCSPSPTLSPDHFGRKFSVEDYQQQKQLPSPTAVSLRLSSAPLPIDFGNKSSSAPLLVKKTVSPARNARKSDDNTKNRVLKQPRSHSERHLADEVLTVSKWDFFEEWIKHSKKDQNEHLFLLFSSKHNICNISDQSVRHIKAKISRFSSKLSEKWKKCGRSREYFLAKHSEWLMDKYIYFDVSRDHSIPSTSAVSLGRPKKDFDDSSFKTKRRRVDDLIQSRSSSELMVAAEVSARLSGNRDVARVIKDVTESREKCNLNKNTMNEKSEGRCLSGNEALAFYVDTKSTSSSYKQTRKWCMKAGHNVFPSIYSVRKAKTACLPPEENIVLSEMRGEIQLQSILDKTVERLVTVQNDVFKSLVPCTSFKLISKWGCDGSSGHSTYKQKFITGDNTDEFLFVFSFVPLQLRNDSDIVWQNPRPSSTMYCRPIKFIFSKETKDFTVSETNRVLEEIKSLVPTTCIIDDSNISVTHELLFPMVDGKICNALTETTSSQKCYICGATPKLMNDESKEFISNTDTFRFGLSTLHAWIRCFECLLHISYRLSVKKWQLRDSIDKIAVQERSTEIKIRFRNEMGLLIDKSKPNYGNTNDGNTARRFFMNPETSAEITGLEVTLIKNFGTLLRALSSGYDINIEKFELLAKETRKQYLNLYSWYYMPVTVHKILTHGAEVIQAALLPIGQLSEEAQEARNKDCRRFLENNTRKISRVASNRDLLNMLLITSDPVINSFRDVPRKKFGNLSSEVLDLLIPPCVGMSQNSALTNPESEGFSTEDSTEDDSDDEF